MTGTRLLKHNPAFFTDVELDATFVVRQPELGILMEVVRENIGTNNQHVVVIGPRGMGKTILLRRLGLNVRQDPKLSEQWYPVVFPEEVYAVANEGEFWLTALQSIMNQEQDQPRWAERFQAIRGERDVQRLKSMSLHALRDFTKSCGKRLIVLVENLQLILGKQVSDDNQWDLRHTLMNDDTFMLVASATAAFDEIRRADKALYELFREIKLNPLSTDDCRKLWKNVSNEDLHDMRIRPMEILTGGSPRLLTILADFAKGKKLSELLDSITLLIDEHTPYLKANVEELPPLERRVFVTLAEWWEPAEAREVAHRCRMDTNKASAVLKKLVKRGAVQEEDTNGRKHRYQIVERLYNIYHLLRLSMGKEAQRMKDFIRLLVPIYGEERLARALGKEICGLEESKRLGFIEAYIELWTSASSSEVRDSIFKSTPRELLELPEAVELRKHQMSNPSENFNDAFRLMNEAFDLLENNKFDDSIIILDQIISQFKGREEEHLKDSVAIATINKGDILVHQGRFEEAIEVYKEARQNIGWRNTFIQEQAVAGAILKLGYLLSKIGRHEQAIRAFNELISQFDIRDDFLNNVFVSNALVNKGIALFSLDHPERAISVFDEVINQFGNREEPLLLEEVSAALINKATVLSAQKRYEEQITTCNEIIERFGEREEISLLENVAKAMVIKGVAYSKQSKLPEVMAAYNEIMERFGYPKEPELLEQVAQAMINMGVIFIIHGQADRVIESYDRTIREFGGNRNVRVRKLLVKTLDSFASTVFQILDHTLLSKALDYAHETIKLEPESNHITHTLACLLGMSGDWKKAFTEAKLFCNYDDFVEGCSNDIIDFFVFAAASGQAEAALKAISGTLVESKMEALVVALLMVAEKPVRAPKEVVEVAKDLIKKIDERRAQIEEKQRELKKDGVGPLGDKASLEESSQASLDSADNTDDEKNSEATDHGDKTSHSYHFNEPEPLNLDLPDKPPPVKQQPKRKKTNLGAAARQILEHYGEPLHYTQIADLLKENGFSLNPKSLPTVLKRTPGVVKGEKPGYYKTGEDDSAEETS